MQPVVFPVERETLLQVWGSFMETGLVGWPENTVADPAILRSWQRCVKRLDPTAKPRPNRAVQQVLQSIIRTQANLISVAIPFMEDIHQFIEGSGCAILLADGSACVHTVVGDRPAITKLEEAGLGKGTYWSEGQLGTNALGMALFEAMPVLVIGPEHYALTCHEYSSAAAPIHDVRGRITGIIAIVGPVDGGSPHMLALVMAAARAISNQLQTDWYLEEANLHLTEVNTVLSAVSEAVIAWSEDGRIHHANDRVADILDLNPAAIVGRPLGETLKLPANLTRAIRDGSEVRDEETTFQVNGRSISCLASLRAIGEGTTRPASYIVMLRPIEQVRRLVHQQMGTQATLTLDDLTSQSTRMREVLRQARIAAKGKAPVLIRGEGGVGKNHLARAIHNDSQRADKPFVVIDCRAIPHELMASEFLGQEKVTGILGRPSKFELAHGGTLLLDQVESLSLELQTALLRVLETGHVMRLGGTHPIPLDVRIMAATTSNLEQMVGEDNFIPHLYYRFGVFNIHIPPVRERLEDVPLIAERFLARISQRDDRPYWINDEAMAVLHRYPWPGNVREMESVLERAINQSQDGIVRVVDLPEGVRRGRVITTDSPQPEPVLSVADAEREAIIRAGRAYQGRVTEMAEQLGIGRTTLWRKMKRLDITPEDFK